MTDAPEAASWEDVLAAYRLILGRAPDDAGARHYAGKIANGGLSLAQLRDEFVLSQEFRLSHGVAFARQSRTGGSLDEAMAQITEVLRLQPSNHEARAEALKIRQARNARKRKAFAEDLGLDADDLPSRLSFVAIGTTGLCNASCVHCPTGKSETDNVPRHPMALPLFEKIVRGIADLDLSVGLLNLGLFGDGLLDPLVVERVRLARTLLPEVHISVNTNAAAYTASRHKSLFGLTSAITIHVESLIPECYDHLMQPLRAERVFPKIEQIIADFPGCVDVSVPVSQVNCRELGAIRNHFLSRGVRNVHFDPLISRTSQDLSLFMKLAIEPAKHNCNRDILDELVVDCDGKVLMCCNDFRRIEPIGDLNKEEFLALLLNERRIAMRSKLDNMEHMQIATCRQCYSDARHSKRWSELASIA